MSDAFLQSIIAVAKEAEVYTPSTYPEQPKGSLGRKRAAEVLRGEETDSRIDVAIGRTATGRLRWEFLETAAGARSTKRASFFRTRTAGDEIIQLFNTPRLADNEYFDLLAKLDKKCNANQSEGPLYQLKDGKWVKIDAPPASGRVLLFVHGTFSNNDGGFLSQLQRTGHGAGLLKWAEGYEAVLGFEHPTIGVTPMCNAADLDRLFCDSEAEVDIIAHSRGGLVTRWWAERIDEKRSTRRVRAVLVGCPLAGTSLASPPNLVRAADDWLNIASILYSRNSGDPAISDIMRAAFGMIRIIGSTALLDAMACLLPGVSAMAMVDNNAELRRLNERAAGQRADVRAKAGALGYYTIRADYEFDEDKRHGEIEVLEAVFTKGRHDLVVDTESMNLRIGRDTDRPQRLFKDDFLFPTGGKVIHTNYFEQKETVERIQDWFK